ncbi:hypothetical protein B0H10DRAFT_2096673, partial [Mycena sp. CBHHK59/15]
MTNPTTCEPNTTKLRQTLPQSPLSKKGPNEARDVARPRAIQLSKSISSTVSNPPVCKRRDCRIEKSFEDRFDSGDRCENAKKDELVDREFHHQALMVGICVWPPSNVENFCESQDTVGDLASTRQGELGMHRTIGRVSRECGGYDNGRQRSGGHGDDGRRRRCGVIDDGVDHRKGGRCPFRERAGKRAPVGALGKEALIPASDGTPRVSRCRTAEGRKVALGRYGIGDMDEVDRLGRKIIVTRVGGVVEIGLEVERHIFGGVAPGEIAPARDGLVGDQRHGRGKRNGGAHGNMSCSQVLFDSQPLLLQELLFSPSLLLLCRRWICHTRVSATRHDEKRRWHP